MSKSPFGNCNSKQILAFAYLICPSVSRLRELKKTQVWSRSLAIYSLNPMHHIPWKQDTLKAYGNLHPRKHPLCYSIKKSLELYSKPY